MRTDIIQTLNSDWYQIAQRVTYNKNICFTEHFHSIKGKVVIVGKIIWSLPNLANLWNYINC